MKLTQQHIEQEIAGQFREFYLEYKDKVYRYALIHLREESQALDIVQEVFSKIWIRFEELDKNQNIKAYLYTVARNTVFDELRKIKIKHNYANTEGQRLPAVDNSNAEHIAFKDLEKVYQQAILQLPSERQRIYLLSKIEYLSNAEIADQLGISVNTVRDQLVKANKSVRAFILSHFEMSITILIFLRIL
ncbi:RNA polymerase sigma-70 factor [Sphingobacterium spiritivorum]|uniref:RNA polymerase sigma-70 factor n=1 Tax=Sphingobacterium spiritivorum ATCC 33861 TaxID=525373 RepID=D7VI68_SPHSI|nr:RNA polymerase sigma-70 factor [Sphingobacterium spiritivorum]EFK59770.1 RNA polymerase sigma-70 factor [Sphingobacterium spiritivorum ATCC 33861]QQT37585.1 RNA polymerase sigma-70 factor [Sphingobacterium spiritivorum]WQD34382.1 RNA polymerase sigma-70 factor [Sphingobacterium spiritivorum]SUI97322.1 RNA polymerase sigma factor sigV [Sphingobacterium spiritivorum]